MLQLTDKIFQKAFDCQIYLNSHDFFKPHIFDTFEPGVEEWSVDEDNSPSGELLIAANGQMKIQFRPAVTKCISSL